MSCQFECDGHTEFQHVLHFTPNGMLFGEADRFFPINWGFLSYMGLIVDRMCVISCGLIVDVISEGKAALRSLSKAEFCPL